jgi:hypothetical protein
MPDRRNALIAAVAAYNRSHRPLPRGADRLLLTMFPTTDVCQQSLEALAAGAGMDRQRVQLVLRALIEAGLVARESTGAGRHANRYRLLLPAGDAP